MGLLRADELSQGDLAVFVPRFRINVPALDSKDINQLVVNTVVKLVDTGMITRLKKIVLSVDSRNDAAATPKPKHRSSGTVGSDSDIALAQALIKVGRQKEKENKGASVIEGCLKTSALEDDELSLPLSLPVLASDFGTTAFTTGSTVEKDMSSNQMPLMAQDLFEQPSHLRRIVAKTVAKANECYRESVQLLEQQQKQGIRKDWGKQREGHWGLGGYE